MKNPGNPTGIIPPCSPVEGKGYKNIINLPDWLNKQKKIKKSGLPRYLTCFYYDTFGQVMRMY
jgi:hypothetical protein